MTKCHNQLNFQFFKAYIDLNSKKLIKSLDLSIEILFVLLINLHINLARLSASFIVYI